MAENVTPNVPNMDAGDLALISVSNVEMCEWKKQIYVWQVVTMSCYSTRILTNRSVIAAMLNVPRGVMALETTSALNAKRLWCMGRTTQKCAWRNVLPLRYCTQMKTEFVNHVIRTVQMGMVFFFVTIMFLSFPIIVFVSEV